MGNTGDGLSGLDGQVQGSLTPEQRENLAKVNARLGVDDFTNPNMADRGYALVEHGLARLTHGGKAWIKAEPQ